MSSAPEGMAPKHARWSALTGVLIHGTLWYFLLNWWIVSWVPSFSNSVEKIGLKLPRATEVLISTGLFLSEHYHLAHVALGVLLLIDGALLVYLDRPHSYRIARELWSGLLFVIPFAYVLFSGVVMLLPYQKLMEGLTRAAETQDVATTKERQRLQGAWYLVSVERSGKVTHAEPASADLLRFEGSRFTWRKAGQELSGTFSPALLNAPKRLNLFPASGSDQGSWQSGVYKFDGTRFVLCVAPPNTIGEDLPIDFDTRGTKNETFVFERREGNAAP